MSYAQALHNFQQAIFSRQTEEIVSLLDARPALDARMDVYIEGYRLRLAQAIASDYPTLEHYLGAERMGALAMAYIESTPPVSYTLDAYPIPFAGFVGQREEAFAASLATLESAIAEVFWMEESEAFQPPANFASEHMLVLRLHLRAAAHIMELDRAAEEYMRQFRAGEAPQRAVADIGHMLVLRHKNEVRRHVLNHTEYALLSRIIGGEPVGAAVGAIAEESPEACAVLARELQNWFARWISEGFFRR